VIQKSGAWFSYGDVRLGQGRENAKAFLQENADVAAAIEERVKEVLGLDGAKEPEAELTLLGD
jgi:recombination protein RecA